MSDIAVETIAATRIVTIDRPDRMNAIDEASEAELIRIWETIEKDNDVRCVVVTGAGERAFSAGQDLD